MHRLMDFLGWMLLGLAAICIVAVVVAVVSIAIVTVWVGGGSLLVWMSTGETAMMWQRVPTLHAWIGFGCLVTVIVFYIWIWWDDLKWKLVRW